MRLLNCRFAISCSVLLAGLSTTSIQANIIVTGNTNAQTLVTALTAGGCGLSNVTATLSALEGTNSTVLSSGLYTVTPPLPATYGLATNGIVLSTGNVADYGTGTNSDTGFTTDFGGLTTSNQNALLSQLTGTNENFDVTQLDIQFDVSPSVTNISLTIVFGSDEFPDNISFDVFGAFLNGTNIAIVGGTIVRSDHPNMAATPGTELDAVLAPGSNAVIVLTAPVAAGSTNNLLTLIIGEPDDGQVDSTVYISALTGLPCGTVTNLGVDVVVTKSDSPDPVTVGSNLTYTVTVTNHGDQDATGVTLVDVLPAAVTFLSDDSSCTVSGQTLTCDIGNLATGETVQVQVVVTANVVGSITNTATVTLNETDSNLANNTATQVTTVNPVGPPPQDIDLTGTWLILETKCKANGTNCKVKGRLEVTNEGTVDAPTSFIRFYLSDDNVFDAGDTLLKQVATGKVKPGRAKMKKLSARTPDGGDPTGQFVIAVIDADNTVSETDETNNEIVFGPL